MKYKLMFMLCILLFTSCVTNKQISINITNSSDVSIDTNIKGSDVEDIKPDLNISGLP